MIRYMLLGGAIAAMASVAPAQPTAEADVPRGKVSNQFICQFDSSVSRANVRAETARAIGNSMGEVLHTYEHTIRGFAVRMPAMANGSPVAELRRNNPKVAGCEQDQYVRALFQGKPGSGPAPAADDGDPETPWGVDRVGGYRDMTGSSKRAWVIDSGVDLNHPDLVVDTGKSYSCVRSRVGADDENGHGTHVAGTIAARKNNNGVAGVAAGLPVVAVRVLDRRGSGTWSCVIAGVDYVKANGKAGDVANMSLGGGFSQSVNDAVIAASSGGIWFSLAAGNDGAHAGNSSPASANGTYIRTISASDSSDRMASWSNYGNPPVDYAEPGVSIYSTYKDGGYRTLSGTSMAAPHHAGLLAVDGSVSTCGHVTQDKDSSPDPIGCH